MEEGRKNSKNKRKIYIIVGVISLIIISTLLTAAITINNSIDLWKNKIYPGISIDGLDVGDKTKEEAITAIEEKIINELKLKKINIKIKDKLLNYTYDELSSTYNIEEAVETALNYGKDYNLFDKHALINNNEDKLNVELNLKYDEEKLKIIEEEIKKQGSVAPKDASLKINQGNISITDDIPGTEINSEYLDAIIRSKLDGTLGEDTNITLEQEAVPARVSKKDLEKIKGPMGSFESDFKSSASARGNNIEIATSMVNGTILMPGEEFSYSKTSQKGRGKYENAPGYVDNKVVQVEGGGICQVCTALYRTVMRSNIPSVERYNHSLPVGYSPLGLDATVAWGSIDYRFKNTYDFPIYIEGTTNDKIIHFTIYGDPAALGGKVYELESQVNGNSADSYQVCYENGNEISRNHVSTDIYGVK